MCVLQQEYKQNVKARNVFKTKKNIALNSCQSHMMDEFSAGASKASQASEEKKMQLFFQELR